MFGKRIILISFALVLSLVGSILAYETVPYVLLEDFESYTDTTHLEATWNDWQHTGPGGGYDFNNAAVALLEIEAVPPYELVHGPTQSLNFDYDFSLVGPGDYAIIRRTFDPVHDFTAGGTPALWLWFYGDANDGQGNLADGMGLTLEDDDNGDGTVDDSWTIHYGDANCVYTGDGDANDLVAKQWMEWGLALEDFNEHNVNPKKVKQLTLHITAPEDATGDIYFDDFRLYVRRCVPLHSWQYGDIAGEDGPDCLVNNWDIGAVGEEWLTSGTKADLIDDDNVNFRDYAIIADVDNWLKNVLWPVE